MSFREDLAAGIPFRPTVTQGPRLYKGEDSEEEPQWILSAAPIS